MVSRHSLKNCVILFAKGLESGKVKTRLCPPLSYSEACRAYRALLSYTVREIRSLKNARKVTFYTGSILSLKDFNSPDLEWMNQGRGSLGQRLQRAFLWSLSEGHGATVLIGSDAFVDLNQRISQAFQQLKKCDMVVGPAWDGGFYLLGFQNQLHKNFFRRIRWSSRHTLLDTLKQARRHAYTVSVLPLEYDVDDETGLRMLRMEFERKNAGSHARQLFRDLQFIQDVLK